MTRLADIQGHIASMDELLDIVGAMRSLAGMRVQEAQHALPGIQRFAGSMAAAIATALLLMPDSMPEIPVSRSSRALILCAGEHGFVGGFNDRLLDAAETVLQGDDTLFVLGSRGAALALERGCQVFWTRPMPTRLAGLSDTIGRLTAALYARIARGELSRVEVMFARYRQGGAPAIERHPLLPFDAASLGVQQPRQKPLHNLEPNELLEKLMAEYVFARVTEAAVESLASENAARFAAMDAARDNVERKLRKLRQEARQARQTEITTELLDLVSGSEGLIGGTGLGGAAANVLTAGRRTP